MGTMEVLEKSDSAFSTAPANAEPPDAVNVLPGTRDLLGVGPNVIGNSFRQLDSSALTFF